MAANKASHFGGEPLAHIEGLLHDLGKYTQEFQKRLEGGPSVDHATHGAQVAAERFGTLGTIMAYAIAGHHAGLANGKGYEGMTSLKRRLQKDDLPTLWESWKTEISLPDLSSFDIRNVLSPEKDRACFQFAFLGRMLFSCLVDADYLDTERFYRQASNEPERDQTFPDLPSLRDELTGYMQDFKADTEINQTRADIFEEVTGKANLEPGLFSLNVPTGGGKTLASLAFALDHAIKHGLRRVIFVIPFTSIVEQNAAVFREALGRYGNKAVVEHHSNFDDKKQAESTATKEKLRLVQQNWEAPVIVTTSVQFFESLYANKTSRCRKLHNIAGSVVVLDEVQTLPVKQLLPCITAMDELALNYHTSLVLCTATQPAIEKAEFKYGLDNVRPLIDRPAELHRKLERVQVQHVGGLSDEELAEEMAEQDQVLCIVNSRRHARSLYERIADLPGVHHLTTSMCAQHRQEKLKTIREQLASDAPCRLVATSLIEAGVDVDFVTVFRAESGLDSVAQAAGRCNREGKRDINHSQVNIFYTTDDWFTPKDVEQFAASARSVLRRFDKALSPEAIKAYFHDLYWIKGPEQMGQKLLKNVESGRIDGIPYEDMAKDFRMIESRMLPVIIPFDDNAKGLINDLKWAEKCGGIARKLQPYLVQIPERSLKAMKEVGAVQAVQPERFGEQFMELANIELYSSEYGLNWDNPTFISGEGSVI